MTYPPPPSGYPDGNDQGHPQYQQYTQPQQGGWGAPDPAGYPDPSGYPGQPGQYGDPGAYGSQPVSGTFGQPPVSVHPISAPNQYERPLLGMPGQPPPPDKSSTPLIVGITVGAVALLGLGTVLVLTLGNGSDDTVADPGTSASAETTSAEPTTQEPEPEPTTAAEKIEDLSYKDFSADWEDTLKTGPEADYVNGWDYASCSEFEDGTALTDRGCEYGVEVAYEAEGGNMRVANFFIGMSDDAAAEDGAAEILDGEYLMQSDSYIDDFSYGMWQTDYYQNIVVITVVTATDDVDDETGDAYLEAMNADMTIIVEGM